MNPSTNGLALKPDAAIDLHLHTTWSDGDWTPEQLFEHLAGEGFGLAAIADHDRPDTAAQVQRLAQQARLPVLAAVEMSTLWQGEMTDLLCYGFEPAPNALEALAQDLLRRQQENTREAYEYLLRIGFLADESPGELAAILEKPSSWQPFELAAVIRKHSRGAEMPPAVKAIMQAGCSFETNDLAAVVQAAHRDGAVCLVAHPGRGDGFMLYDAPLLDRLRAEIPIDGLEVYHTRHTPAQSEMYLEYARRHGLLVSAGSDSHRPDKPPVRYPAACCQALLERLGIRVGGSER